MADDARDTRTSTVHRWFEDLGVFIGGAVALLVLGSLFLFAVFQGPSSLQWTGTAVPAVESGGITYYSFHGQNYTLNAPLPRVSSSTVYLDPANPSNATFSYPVTRWTDFACVAGPYTSSVLWLTFGLVRRSRRRRNSLKNGGTELSFDARLDRRLAVASTGKRTSD